MYIEVAAHCGNVAVCPENTMPVYKSAYDIGAELITSDEPEFMIAELAKSGLRRR